MHAREEGRRTKSREKDKQSRDAEERRRVASSRARDTRGEWGTTTSHGKHNTTRWRKRRGHQGHERREAAPDTTAPRHTRHHHKPTSTQTPHRHHTQRTHPSPAARPSDGRHTQVHAPAPTASERRALAARPKDRQPGEGERLTPGAPSQWRAAPPRRRPPATPTARNDGSQERTLWGRCWVPTPTPTAPGKHGYWNPGRPP